MINVPPGQTGLLQAEPSRLLCVQQYGRQTGFCLADPEVLGSFLQTERNTTFAQMLETASRQGVLVWIQNQDGREEGHTRPVRFLLLIREPIPGILAPYSREELSEVLLDLPTGCLMLHTMSGLTTEEGEWLREKPPNPVDADEYSMSTQTIPPGRYAIEIFSLNYGPGTRRRLIEEQISEPDLEAFRRWQSWRLKGCTIGCLGFPVGLVVTIVFVIFRRQELAWWSGSLTVLLLLVPIWINRLITGNTRFQQISMEVVKAQERYPDGIIRLTPSDEQLDGRPAQCGWVFETETDID